MKFSELTSFFFSLLLVSSCSHQTKKPSTSDNFTLFTMNNAPFIGETMSGQKIKLGGFSGLQFTGEKEGSFYFQTITDRGPNGSPDKDSHRPFLLPDYSPEIIVLKADLTSKELSVVKQIKLKKKDGTPLTGLPNSRAEENPIDVFGLYYSIDQDGLDLEGLVFDGDGGWWTADEYSPSLVHFTEEGKMSRRLRPGFEIPKLYSNRKPNRGFEGVAHFNTKIYGFLQSPLVEDRHEGPEKKSDFSRIVEVDLETMKTSAEYFYPFEIGNEKIGDAVAIAPRTLLVLEQNGQIGEKSQKYIYRIKLGESDEVVEKTLIADLKNTPFNSFEKIEGMALIDNYRLALIYDNDFQVSGVTDPRTGLTALNESLNQLLVLEFKASLIDSL